jgi:hypothetical protein
MILLQSFSEVLQSQSCNRQPVWGSCSRLDLNRQRIRNFTPLIPPPSCSRDPGKRIKKNFSILKYKIWIHEGAIGALWGRSLGRWDGLGPEDLMTGAAEIQGALCWYQWWAALAMWTNLYVSCQDTWEYWDRRNWHSWHIGGSLLRQGHGRRRAPHVVWVYFPLHRSSVSLQGGENARAHTHTPTHTNRCGDDWFEVFIGDSQSHQTGREEGASTHFQERRHLLQLNLDYFPRTLEETDYVVLTFTYFTSTKVQILVPEERRDPLHLFYEYKITDTRSRLHLKNSKYVFLYSSWHTDNRTSGNSVVPVGTQHQVVWVYEFQTCTVCDDRRLY